jgi:hypothetical protein
MGYFLAATAFHSESVPEIVQAITEQMRSHDVTHEVLPGSSAFDEATDAQVFPPQNGWCVVLWPTYFNIHDFPLAKALAMARPWLISTVHVYDDHYWEHLAVQGSNELQSFCSCPTYWEDQPSELERVAKFKPSANQIAAAAGVSATTLEPYLVDTDKLSDQAVKAYAEDQHPLSDIWVFTDFWRRLGIVYPDPQENPAAIVRLSKWFAKRLPTG